MSIRETVTLRLAMMFHVSSLIRREFGSPTMNIQNDFISASLPQPKQPSIRTEFIDQDREFVLFGAFFINLAGTLDTQPLHLPGI